MEVEVFFFSYIIGFELRTLPESRPHHDCGRNSQITLSSCGVSHDVHLCVSCVHLFLVLDPCHWPCQEWPLWDHDPFVHDCVVVDEPVWASVTLIDSINDGSIIKVVLNTFVRWWTFTKWICCFTEPKCTSQSSVPTFAIFDVLCACVQGFVWWAVLSHRSFFGSRCRASFFVQHW